MRFLNTKYSFLFLLSSLLFSCAGNKEEQVEIPKTILSREQFTKVLMDYALAESASNLNILDAPFQKTDTLYAFDPLKENGIRKSLYDSSIAFYAAHSALYKKIYEDVLQKITEYQTRRNDSLTKTVR